MRDFVALSTLAADPLGALVGHFREAHPGIAVRIAAPDDVGAVDAMVLDGRCELGLTELPPRREELVAVTLERQEIVAYREARGDEVRDARFRAQFVGKSARDTVRAGDDIVAVSGATISSRAMATGVRRALVLLDVLVLAPQRQASASAHR